MKPNSFQISEFSDSVNGCSANFPKEGTYKENL